MKKTTQVSASILCCDFTRLGDEIKKCEDARVDSLHVDVMDGHFVPNISIGTVIIEAIRSKTRLPIEAHLMIENPTRYIDAFMAAGADIVSIHAECYGPLKENCRLPGQFPKEVDLIDAPAALADIRKIRQKGKKAFIAVNPGTPLCIKPLLEEVDGVLVMSVNPGFTKQKFIPEALLKIQELKKGYSGNISVDGGVNALSASQAVKAGADILVTASYFFGSLDPKSLVKALKELRARG